jgi:hypothetical protein
MKFFEFWSMDPLQVRLILNLFIAQTHCKDSQARAFITETLSVYSALNPQAFWKAVEVYDVKDQDSGPQLCGSCVSMCLSHSGHRAA